MRSIFIAVFLNCFHLLIVGTTHPRTLHSIFQFSHALRAPWFMTKKMYVSTHAFDHAFDHATNTQSARYVRELVSRILEQIIG